MKAHDIINDMAQTAPLGYCGRVTPAEKEHVQFLLGKKKGEEDCRSDWVWIRLANGDLCLATFPYGDTYLHVVDTLLKGKI